MNSYPDQAQTTLSPPTLKPNPVRRRWRSLRQAFSGAPLSVVGGIGFLIFLLMAAVGPFFAPYDPIANSFSERLQVASVQHLFGTDNFGRDILSRVIYGAQISLKVAILAEGLGIIIGTLIGLITGYYGGWLDALIMRLVDIFMAFPLLIIAIALVAALGPGETNIFIALALVIWPFVARLVRSQVLSIRESEYIAAARLVGVSDVGIMLRHILPNILTPLVVFATLGTANVILQEAALSFLGLGSAEKSTPSWGKMLNESRAFIRSAWWMPFFPGMVILIAVLGFNLVGDGLRDALDVRAQ